MIGYRIRAFLDHYREAGRTMRLFLLWNAANTVLAFALLVGSFVLLVVANAPGSQRPLLLSFTVVAVLWLLSVFVIGPVYDRVDPAE